MLPKNIAAFAFISFLAGGCGCAANRLTETNTPENGKVSSSSLVVRLGARTINRDQRVYFMVSTVDPDLGIFKDEYFDWATSDQSDLQWLKNVSVNIRISKFTGRLEVSGKIGDEKVFLEILPYSLSPSRHDNPPLAGHSTSAVNGAYKVVCTLLDCERVLVPIERQTIDASIVKFSYALYAVDLIED